MIDIMKYYYKHICGLLFLALVAVGCSQDDVAAGDGEGGVGELTDSYVTLNFTMAFAGQGTRSNPTGGENGDRTEAGQDYENEISNAVAFLYQDDAGVNSSADPQVTPIYFSTVNKVAVGEYSTNPVRITLPNGDYHIIVVANPGSGQWWNSTTTLNAVRDYLVYSPTSQSSQTSNPTAWTEAEDGYSDFLMSSASDALFTLESNPQSDPLDVDVSVERMAARIDYQAEGSFPCSDQTGSVEILGAAIVNDYNAGCYLLKRVADEVGGDVTYLGNETLTNYVIDPKTVSGKASTDYKEDTYYPDIIDNGNDLADPNVWADYVKKGTPIAVDGKTWNRIGYTMENTTPTTSDLASTNTGVVFKARFSPATNTVKGNYDYSRPATFFSYRGALYASMEDVMKSVYGTAFDDFDNKIAACKSWEDVKAFIAENLNQLDPSGYDDYLSGLVEAGGTFSTDGLTWSEYMLANCGYSSTTSGNNVAVTLDQGSGVVTRVALRPYGVSTYENATCYYTWWVKHSNDNDNSKVGPMEYGIVRNNIYKLTVKSVAGLGGDVPGGKPESGDDIVIHVKVNDWMLLDEEEIIM